MLTIGTEPVIDDLLVPHEQPELGNIFGQSAFNSKIDYLRASLADEVAVRVGVAVIVETMTDNRNRTAADVRSAFSHAGGNLGTSGSVAFQFERKGQIVVAKEILDENAKKETMIANGAAGDEDEFMMAIAEAGGEDYEDAGEEWIVWTAANDVMAVSKALEEQGIQVKGSETTMVPTTPTEVSGADAKKVQRLIDRLEELDDVQDVYSTMDMTDEVIAALEEE